jgi:hypothetical protein
MFDHSTRACATEQLKAELLTQSSTGLAHFHCSFGTLMSQKSNMILASLVVQACATLPGLYDDVSTKFTPLLERGMPQTIETAELLPILVKHVSKLNRFYICIDAINESFEFDAIQGMLSTLVEQCSNIRLFVTSTHNHRDGDFRNARTIASTMNVDFVDHDIAAYIDQTLSAKTKSTHLDAIIQNDIRNAIVHKSDGV